MTLKANHPGINALWGAIIVEELVRLGVEYFVISPGSRSTPLTLAVARREGVVQCVHFDERGAAFHALGYARATGKPAVVICTSGTAAANYYPAVVEAHTDRVPMILLTADRPPELHEVGANQTIDQCRLYGEYTRWATSIPCPDPAISARHIVSVVDQAYCRAMTTPAGPVHVNCMFREPLAPPDETEDFSEYLSPLPHWLELSTPLTEYAPSIATLSDGNFDRLAEYFNNIDSGLIFVGPVSWGTERDSVVDLVRKLGWPVIPDILSGMRLGIIDDNIIPYSDCLLMAGKHLAIESPKVVLHIGGRPTSERVQAFLSSLHPDAYIQVCDHSERIDQSATVTNRLTCSIPRFVDNIRRQLIPREVPELWAAEQRVAVKQSIIDLLDNAETLNEPAVCRLVSRHIVDMSALFLASSLPIREINSFAVEDGPAVSVAANRGVSGIDGTVASAVGYAKGLRRQVTLVVGDLALLHDLNSLALTRKLRDPLVIVVLNNNGGGIFNLLPIADQADVFERFFAVPHDMTFEKVAAMFGLDYYRPQTPVEFTNQYRASQRNPRSALIEVTTSRTETAELYRALKKRVIETLSS